MEGSFCFTICGDPLYFAPEIVTQQGYDYSVDLWAFGVLMYELYEGTTPFGTSESDETSVFKAISSYIPSKLQFTSKTSNEAQVLIKDLLQYDGNSRTGYKNEDGVKEAEYFSGSFLSMELFFWFLISFFLRF
jgi:serine/threonine protein kinase